MAAEPKEMSWTVCSGGFCELRAAPSSPWDNVLSVPRRTWPARPELTFPAYFWPWRPDAPLGPIHLHLWSGESDGGRRDRALQRSAGQRGAMATVPSDHPANLPGSGWQPAPDRHNPSCSGSCGIARNVKEPFAWSWRTRACRSWAEPGPRRGLDVSPSTLKYLGKVAISGRSFLGKENNSITIHTSAQLFET